MNDPVFKERRAESQDFMSRFQNWLCTVNVQDVCKWYLKWNVLAVLALIALIAVFTTLLDINFLHDEEYSVWGVLLGVPFAIMFFLFNYIVTDRIMQIKRKAFLSCLLTNALAINTVISLYENVDAYIKYAIPYLNVIPMVLIIVFFYVVYQYAYTVYRLPILLNILIFTVCTAVGILITKGSVNEESLFMGFLGIVVLVLGIVSYILLYKTAKKYNM